MIVLGVRLCIVGRLGVWILSLAVRVGKRSGDRLCCGRCRVDAGMRVVRLATVWLGAIGLHGQRRERKRPTASEAASSRRQWPAKV